MKKIFAILISLALVLSLGALTAAPAIAADKPTDETPTISPVRADFDLCDPDDVITTVTEWGCALNVTIVDLDIGVDYAVVGDTITIFEEWLASATGGDLSEINQQLCLTVHFEGTCLDGGVYETEFCIHAVGHLPTLSPVTAEFNLCDPADVTTTIDWCAATDIVSVSSPGYAVNEGEAWIVDGDELVILKSWLESDTGANLTAINDQIVLYVTFDYESYEKPFVITAGCDCPSVSPELLEWDLTYCTQDPAVLTTEINWGAATEIIEIRAYLMGINANFELKKPLLPFDFSPLTPGVHYAVDGDTLIILKGFFDTIILIGKETTPIDLAIEFDTDTCHKVNLTVVGTGDDPGFLVPSIEYDICHPLLDTSPAGMVVNWGKASDVTGFKEATLNGDALSSIVPPGPPAYGTLSAWELLNGGLAWTVLRSYYVDVLGTHGDAVVWFGWFLNLLLQNPGDTLWFVVEFDVVDGLTGEPLNAEFTITATGVTAGISPTSAEYNLDYALNCTPCADTYAQNVTTIVTWGCNGKGIEKIVDRSYNATADDMDDVPEVLVDGEYDGSTTHYYIDEASTNDTTGKLFIWDNYLREVLTYMGDSVVLNIVFKSGDEVDCVKPHEATLTITGTGSGCTLSPTTGEFNLSDPKNVSVVVTKNRCCTNVTDVYHGSTPLTDGVDYLVTPDVWSDLLGKEVTWLTITKAWLEAEDGGNLEEVGDTVSLTAIFGPTYGKATLTIEATVDEGAAAMCFIATAAGADAPQLDILREFRDEVLLPNRLGAELVSLYYEASPPIAEFISQNEVLKAVIMKGLIDPIVAILNGSHDLWS